jgi:hypothetical protein
MLQSCLEDSDQYLNATQSVVTVDSVTVCASGENIIIYDIGTLDSNGLFTVTVPMAYSTQVFVQTGPIAAFRVVLQEARPERTYTKLRSNIAVEFFDAGRNVSQLFQMMHYLDDYEILT